MEGKGRIDVAALLVGKPKGEETEASSSDMACKAMWKAIKGDDYEGFKEALGDFVKYSKSDPGEPDADD